MNENLHTGWLIDTHCHLDFSNFDPDRNAVLSKAHSQGVKAVVNPGITLENSQQIIQLTAETSNVYAAVGVHPNEADTWSSEAVDRLKIFTQQDKVVAIGEIGLDYYWLKADRQTQQRIFEAQLRLAAECDLPVIIHTRDSINDVISVLRNWVSAIKSPSATLIKDYGVLHSFSGNLGDALAVIEMGFLIGISGPITFRNGKTMVEVVQGIPIENIVIETDSPFLSPHPFRGQRNEPGRVKLIAEKIAEVKDIPYNEVCVRTTENASRLFRGRVRINHD